MTEPLYGLQIYTVREALAEDFKGTLQRLYDLGIRHLEIFRGLPLPPEEAAAMMKDMGFTVSTGHLPMLVGDDAESGLATAKAFGVEAYIIPWVPAENFATVEAAKAFAAKLNEGQKIAADNGMSFGYHNHEFEFAKVDGDKTGYEVVVEETDPSVLFELDTYWVQVGGLNPVELIGKLGARVPYIHIKDGPADPADRNAHMVAFGEGNMDVSGIVRASLANNAKGIFVELDHCATDMMEAVSKSWAYLKSEGFIS